VVNIEKCQHLHASLRDACKWTGVALMGGHKSGTELSFQEWESTEGSVLRIGGAIVDSSDRHQASRRNRPGQSVRSQSGRTSLLVRQPSS
jgi:hypothetical protein